MKKMQAIRPHEDGTVDDVAITCDMFRLEQMDDDCFWAAAYRGEKEAMFAIKWDKKLKRLVATCYSDTIGCEDDRTRAEEP